MKTPKPKGNAAELVLCKKFSLWLSHGESDDWFVRNVTSGARWTLRSKGVPGDLMGAHPRAHEFLTGFFIEAKHWKDLHLEAALWGKGEFYPVIKLAQGIGRLTGRNYLVAARRNHRPTLLFMSHLIGTDCLLKLCPSIIYHKLWNGEVFVCFLDEALKADPDRFMDLALKADPDRFMDLRGGSTTDEGKME